MVETFQIRLERKKLTLKLFVAISTDSLIGYLQNSFIQTCLNIEEERKYKSKVSLRVEVVRHSS